MFIVTAKEMYDVDSHTMDRVGYDGKLLMENAGRAVCEKMKSILSKHDQVGILIGSGNNGGDGYVISRTLLNDGYNVLAIQIVPDEKIKGDARYHKEIYKNCGGAVHVAQSADELEIHLHHVNVVVDAMLGIGMKGMLREPLKKVVSLVNQSGKKVIAIDIPTGLPSDEGITDFYAIQADRTFIIEAPKESVFVQHTAPYYGTWETTSIGIPSQAFSNVTAKSTWEEDNFKQSLPKREAFSHKGEHGKGLVVGGSKEMPGSIAMTAKAALRAGAGLVTIGTQEGIIGSIAPACLEATFLPIPENGPISSSQLEPYHAIAIGMGLGRGKQAGGIVAGVVKSADCPIIIDADGLFHIKKNLSLLGNRSAPTILTPHPGEMAMLMDCPIEEIVHAPFDYAKRLSKEYGVYVILKGKYTIITTPDGKQTVNQTGNPGLAKGGSGDVLSGVILSMVMQKGTIEEGLCNACYLHGKAADLSVSEGHSYYDLLATDVIKGFPLVFRT
ncbi:bifunctional ADP-dependent NAD(P)H-hydrate dehydratase/NAD(P)H-hydrate epimerase [Virgibacillus phasianinus]|uniref:Bifunctional NAD(P)H-hydrate repair enzyme n=1 Tax=Virgibacillus phasianinus TaxID=2017483 RepID=A0A220TZS3_9BACI|nr:NAD(P)H-hydrate dehydratase [Virgibacillus phasianinus]ASK61255.1 bifunctional ADP-dependent NAD(P)H-hydrate dehydratase/NAD(P)H-hydrate epimerase [Virgibacillus phasianinus]